MSQIIIEVPMTGVVESVRENKFGRINSGGGNRPVGNAELIGLYGVEMPSGMRLQSEVIDSDPSAGSCTLKITTQDDHRGWLEGLLAKVLSVCGSEGPELLRFEVQKMEMITVEFSEGGHAVGIDYDSARDPDVRKFDQISLTSPAFDSLEELLQLRIDQGVTIPRASRPS